MCKHPASSTALTGSLVPQLPVRRAPHRCHHSHQSPRARPWRQFWCLGRALQHIRLRGQGHTEEGGPLECHYCGILHRRLACSTRRLPIDAQRCDIVCDSARSHRGRFDWLQPHDGRQYEARCSPTSAQRRRPIFERRWRHGGRCIDFHLAYTYHTAGGHNVRNEQHTVKNGVWLAGLHTSLAWFWQRVALALSSASMTFLYHILDTIVQQVAHLQKKAGAHDQDIETLHPGPLSLHFLLGSSHLGTAHISVLRRHPYESPKAEQQPTLGEERKLFKMEKSMPASTFKAAKRNDVRIAAEFRPDLQPWHVQHCFI